MSTDTTQLQPPPKRPPNPFVQAIEAVGGTITKTVEDIGGLATLLIDVIRWGVRPPFRVVNLMAQLDFVGVGSVLIVALTGIFSGMVFAHQSARAFEMFNAKSLVGPTVTLTITRELAPVFSALMVTMRAGSAMCTELGTMRVSEQIDALACLGVDPVKHLVAPRFLACLLMIPMLTVFADIAGLVGCTIICLHVYGIDTHHYWEQSRNYVGVWDVFVGVAKAFVLGGVMALIACHRGFHSKAGAAGVGRAATQAFVFAFVSIIVLDFVLSMFANSVHDIVWPDAKSKVI